MSRNLVCGAAVHFGGGAGTGGAAWNEDDGTNFYFQNVAEAGRAEQRVDTTADEMGEFCRSIRGEATPETGGAEGLEVIALMEAAVASSESGRAETVPDFR